MASAIETVLSIAGCKSLVDANLRYCLMNKNKMPLKVDGTPARPNVMEDFVSLDEISKSPILPTCAGVGISIQANNICAIDVDHCFSKPFDLLSGDKRAEAFITSFRFMTYIEFSFSGTGLRILFYADLIDNYEEKYYIKNSNNEVEYYQPSKSNRYVSLTGKTISRMPIKKIDNVLLFAFLDQYMVRKIPLKKVEDLENYKEDKSFEELWQKVKTCYLKDFTFQEVILNSPPPKLKDGCTGKSESEVDYYIICYLFQHVTKDKDMIKKLIENTYYFKHKDHEHLRKWNNGYYYSYQYNNAARSV